MTRALPRTNFNSSRLSRFLADLDLMAATAPGPAFAERLGEWLDAADAMRLYAAHNAGAGPQDAQSSTPPAAPVALGEECARLRAALADGIAQSCTPGGTTRIRLPLPDPGAPADLAADYEPYRRFQLAQQRDMDAAIGPLRARVREALAQAAPPLRKLATLDAALDDILAGRESKLLATVPALLEKRFVQLREAHRQTLADPQADDSGTWLNPGGWLARFCQEMQAALLAELDLRLQPVIGLIEAFSNEVSQQ
jgi:hypothetical protein